MRYHYILDPLIHLNSICSWAANSVLGGRVYFKFEPIQDFMHVLVTCKPEEHPFKNEDAHNISPIVSLWGFFQTFKGISLCSPGLIW